MTTSTYATTHTASFALRHAAEFLDHAAEIIDAGQPITGPEVVDRFRWAVMKAVEFNEMLPGDLRGDLSAECFQR